MNKKKLKKFKKLSDHLAKSSNLLYELGWRYEMKGVDRILETVEEIIEEEGKPRSITKELLGR